MIKDFMSDIHASSLWNDIKHNYKWSKVSDGNMISYKSLILITLKYNNGKHEVEV